MTPFWYKLTANRHRKPGCAAMKRALPILCGKSMTMASYNCHIPIGFTNNINDLFAARLLQPMPNLSLFHYLLLQCNNVAR